jgi:transposase-like protein
MERRKFTREFKLEAVRLIKDRGVSYVQACIGSIDWLILIRR